MSESKTSKIKRVILEGNLFRASQISESRKVGRAVTYTDEKGTWHHAILMPRGMSLESVSYLDLDITDYKMMFALMNAKERITITDDQNMEHMSYRLDKSKDGITLTYYAEKNDVAWIIGEQALKAFYVGDWHGMRGMRKVHINEIKLEEFCKTFIEHSVINSTPVTVNGSYRQWALEYSENLRPKTSALTIKETSNMISDDSLDDIDAKLAAMNL